MTPKKFIPYDDPAHLFRRYRAWECEEDGGYPFIWTTISKVIYTSTQDLAKVPAEALAGAIDAPLVS
jgi:hypothetical protein